MYRYLIALNVVCCFLIGCSSTPGAENDATAIEQTTAEPEFNTEAPTSYAQYKRWRAQNDPDGQAYADYKAWENAYQQWKAEQDKP